MKDLKIGSKFIRGLKRFIYAPLKEKYYTIVNIDNRLYYKDFLERNIFGGLVTISYSRIGKRAEGCERFIIDHPEANQYGVDRTKLKANREIYSV